MYRVSIDQLKHINIMTKETKSKIKSIEKGLSEEVYYGVKIYPAGFSREDNISCQIVFFDDFGVEYIVEIVATRIHHIYDIVGYYSNHNYLIEKISKYFK